MDCPLCDSDECEIFRLNTCIVNQCKQCSLQFIDEENDIEKSDYLKRYSKSRKEDSELSILRKIQYNLDIEHLKKNISKGNVLDVGCSTGIFLDSFDTESNFNLYGIDIDEDAIRFAKNKCNQKINFLKTDLINFETNLKFDCIVFRGSFQFLGNDLRKTMERISDLSSHNSKIVIYSLPNSDSILYYLLKDGWHLFDKFSHTLIFNRRSIMELCKKFNYRILECSYPYIETPYANMKKDYEKLIKLIKFGEKDSFPFWGNIMQLVLEKK